MARPFATLAGAVVLLGVAESMAGSYLVLFASQRADLSPLQVGLFVSAPAAGGLEHWGSATTLLLCGITAALGAAAFLVAASPRPIRRLRPFVTGSA